MALEIAHNFRPLPRIAGDGLADIERVQKTVGRIGIVDRREIVRHELGQLDCRIIVKISGEIERDVELPGVDHLLPFPDIASVLSRGDPDLAPALG